MTLLAEIGVVGAVIESVPGVAEPVTGADCNLMFEDLAWTVEPVSVEQPVVKTAMGRIKQRPGGRSMSCTFKVGLKGSGAPGTAPAIGTFLKACQMAETVRPGVGTWYNPTTLSVVTQPTLTLYFNNDGRYRTAKGCMGTVNFTGAGNEIHYAEFEFRGVFHGEGDASVLVPSLEITHPDVLLESKARLLEYGPGSTRIQTVAGVEDLRQGAGANDRLAAVIDNTAGGNMELGGFRVYLQRTGLPVGFTNGIWGEIWTDAVGVPNALVAGAVSAYRSPVYMRDDAYDFVDFLFTAPVAIVAGTVYHAVVNGDFTVGANIVDWATYATGVASTSSQDNAGWANLGGNDNFIVDVLTAPKACLFMESVGFDHANTVNLRQDVACSPEGWDRAFISSRAPVITIEPEQEKIADRDFLAYHKNATELFFGYGVGAAQGSLIEIAAEYCQVVNAGETGDRDGATTAPLEIQPSSGIPVTAGNDDYVIKFL